MSRRGAAARRIDDLASAEAEEGAADGATPLFDHGVFARHGGCAWSGEVVGFPDARGRREGRGSARGGKPPKRFRAPRADRPAAAADARSADATPRWERRVRPMSQGQARAMEALASSDITVLLGCSGTGKTFLPVHAGLDMLQRGEVSRLVLARPAVEAGERLGFLPGGPEDKVGPYFLPLISALEHRLSPREIAAMRADGRLEIAPLAYMRGRTLFRSYVVLDEAQNATAAQIKMLLTRIGPGTRIAVSGDPSQVDLPPGQSGLASVAASLDGRVGGLSVVRLGEADVVRHPIIREILAALGEGSRDDAGEAREGAAE